jgi:GNAT superfamily N-acetyltransferase
VRAGRTEVIELDGMPIGVQLVDRPGTHVQLEQLSIEKAFQGQGFGTHLLNQLGVVANMLRGKATRHTGARWGFCTCLVCWCSCLCRTGTRMRDSDRCSLRRWIRIVSGGDQLRRE